MPGTPQGLMATQMQNTVTIKLNLDHLHHNYRLLKKLAPAAQVFAVVKSDAYGHGLLNIASGLPEADGFALIQLEDAITLRSAGIAQPILLMAGVNDVQEVAEARARQITIVVHHRDHLAMIRAAGAQQPLLVWVKVNSNMNRFGFNPVEVIGILRQLQAMPNVHVEGLMMHFPCADLLDQELHDQWNTFRELIALTNLPFSAANSAAMLRDARTHGDLVRTGAALYGINPFPGEDRFRLRPVMHFEARLIAITQLSAGESVGYEGGFVAQRAMRIGVIGCGYGNGYPSTARTGTPVSIAGVRTRIIGKVAMNVIFIDLESARKAKVGDWATMWGNDVVQIEEVARNSGLSAAAIDCSMSRKQVVSR